MGDVSESSTSAEDQDDSYYTDGKKRPPPFSTYDTNKLLELIDEMKKKGFLESDCNKGVDRIKKQNAAWKQIHLEYNNDPYTSTRELNQLKKRYDNLKFRTKRDAAIANDKNRHKSKARKRVSKRMKDPSGLKMDVENGMDHFNNDSNSNSFSNPLTECADSVDTGFKQAKAACISNSNINIASPSLSLPNLTSKQKQTSNPPEATSTDVDWEYEERKLRLKTLSIAQETEILRREKVKLEIEQSREVHQMQIKLLVAKINHFDRS